MQHKMANKESSELYQNRLDTKLYLRKTKIKESLSKMKMLTCSVSSGKGKVDEAFFLINVEKLGLKSEITNKNFADQDMGEYIRFHLDLLKCNDLSKAKFAVTSFKDLIVKLDDEIPSELTSVEFLSSLYLLLNNFRLEFDLIVSTPK